MAYMMKIRLEIMRNLLSEDGIIMVHIDDDEMPYLKILMDEIFGDIVKHRTKQFRQSRGNYCMAKNLLSK